MTKEKYMALADLQTVWNDKLKPHIQQTYATKTELNALLGPTYDEDDEGIVFPITSRASYDSSGEGITIE